MTPEMMALAVNLTELMPFSNTGMDAETRGYFKGLKAALWQILVVDFQDRRVQRYIQELESADPPLTPAQWRMVVEGHGEKIARSCGRACSLGAGQ